MDFNGILIFKIADKGNLVDLRFNFLAGQGSQNLAVYTFDNDSSGEEQAYADAAVRARVAKKRPKMKIRILGERAPNPLQQQMTQAFNKLATNAGHKAEAKISKLVPAANGGGSGSFTVTLKGLTTKTSKIVLDVPFEGDPGTLAGKSFHGNLSLLVHSKEVDADIPGILNILLDVKPDPDP